MVAKLLTTSIAAPGFLGLNTQDSIVSLEAGYATIATNCVIDKFGRIGSRKGWTPAHDANTDLGNNNVEAIGELITDAGVSYVIVAGNNKLFSLAGTTLTTLTYGGGGVAPTISANNWQMAALNGCLYLYQAGHDPLVFDPAVSTTTYKRISEKSGYLGTVSQNNCAVSAYGRTWTANNATDKSTIQFSDLLNGHVFTGGTSGTLDISTIWPAGPDEIVALAAHNGFLVIFGRRQIIVYANAKDPTNITLQDTITGVGCFARDSVVATGTDLMFLSDNGVRSLQRVIQEKSSPMRDISSNIRDDVVTMSLASTASKIKAVYSDTEAFYLLGFPEAGITYCFDTRSVLQNGANRATTWDGSVPTAMFYTRDKRVLFGKPGYVGVYGSYLDNQATYVMKYYTNYFDFGAPTALKIMKKVSVITIGGAGYTVTLKFGFDYSDILNSRQFGITDASAVAEYNIAEYNIGEYGEGEAAFDKKTINIGGVGNVIQLGFETVINGRSISIQKLDVFTKVGKTR